MWKLTVPAFAALLVFGFAPWARAETVTLSAVQDATLDQSIGRDDSAAVGPMMFVGAVERAPGGAGLLAVRRAAIAFDVAGSLPAGARIDEVELSLYCAEVAEETGFEVTLHRLDADWSEGARNRDNGQTMPSHPFVPAASATTTVGTTGSYTWGSSPEMVADVQAWIDSAAPDHGWLLRSVETDVAATKGFATRENDLAERRPRLVVTYTPAEELDVSATPNERFPLLPLLALAIVSPLMLLGVVIAMYRISIRPPRR
jgi:hypothetical protein